MSSRRRQLDLDEELRAAVRRFVSLPHGTGSIIADSTDLLRITSGLPLSNLSRWEQSIRDEFAFARRQNAVAQQRGWRGLFRSPGPTDCAEPGRLLTWVDLAHSDGRIRERTLRALTGPAPNAFFLALATRRLNDWVPQVRAAARETVPRLTRASDPEHVVDVLCTILPAWTSWQRLTEIDTVVMAELVSLERVAPALKRRVMTSAAGPMSLILSQALRVPALDDELVEIAAIAVQPSVRARAYRALFLGKSVWVKDRQWQWTDVRYCKGRFTNVLGERPILAPPLAESLGAAAADRSSVVRRVAAEALIRELGSLGHAAAPLARKFAGDSSPAVAERGVFAVKQLGI